MAIVSGIIGDFSVATLAYFQKGQQIILSTNGGFTSIPAVLHMQRDGIGVSVGERSEDCGEFNRSFRQAVKDLGGERTMIATLAPVLKHLPGVYAESGNFKTDIRRHVRNHKFHSLEENILALHSKTGIDTDTLKIPHDVTAQLEVQGEFYDVKVSGKTSEFKISGIPGAAVPLRSNLSLDNN